MIFMKMRMIIIITVIITTTTITIIMIALKGAIRDFYNLLTAPATVSNTDAIVFKSHAIHIVLITCNTYSAYHMQYI